MGKLIDLRAQHLLGTKEYKGKGQRIKKEKKELLELQVHQQKVDVQTHESHQKITKLFHKEYSEIVSRADTLERRLSRLTLEKEAPTRLCQEGSRLLDTENAYRRGGGSHCTMDRGSS